MSKKQQKNNKQTPHTDSNNISKIGIDIVEISRIERILQKYNNAFLKRFLRKKEIKLLESKAFVASSVAGFFASKEACSKALGVGISKHLAFKDMILSYTRTNAPQISLSKRAKKYVGNKSLSLSISHDGGFAIAVVVAI